MYFATALDPTKETAFTRGSANSWSTVALVPCTRFITPAAYGIPTVALRFFNAYGPFQALSNPYTGVLSNFASRVLNGRPPLIYEDGLQKRDFISVYDVARACRLALESDRADGHAINISSGKPMTVKDIANKTIRAIGTAYRDEYGRNWNVYARAYDGIPELLDTVTGRGLNSSSSNAAVSTGFSPLFGSAPQNGQSFAAASMS